MTRILLYGGCHALVLKNLLDSLYGSPRADVAVIINFQLIASGQPFPYERLADYDFFIYSPVENKGQYNTDVIAQRCRASGVQVICFPWMEWHGYCPGAVKGVFKGRYQWHYPGLLDLARHFDTFGSFVDHVVAHYPADETIDQIFEASSSRLASSEDRHDMPVRINDFIRKNFRQSRLFFISDHPSLAIYLHVIDQLAVLVGLEKPLPCTLPEPQADWRTPILPRVATRLGLDFSDSHWRDVDLLAGRESDLQTYLGLYFYEDSVVLGPGQDGTLYAEMGDSDVAQCVDPNTRIFALPTARREQAGLDEFVCLAMLSGQGIIIKQNTRFSIDTKQWRSTWDS